MPNEYERLRKQIEDGVHAADELKKLLAEAKREGHHRKPKFKLIKGSIIGGAVWAGVEWFRDYRRGALALLATGAAAAGAAVFTEQQDPGAPSAEPPAATQSIKPRPIRPPVSPPPPTKTVATPGPTFTTPPRTSPLRTLGTRVINPTVRPTSTRSASPTFSPTISPVVTPTVLDTPTLIKMTPSATVTPPVTVRPLINTTCPGVITDLSRVKLCLPLGR